KNAATREQAARALGQVGTEAESAVPGLKAVLRDDNAASSAAAAEALSKVGKEGVKVLSEAAADDRRQTRRHALDALGKQGGPEAVDGLLDTLLKSKYADARLRAATVLTGLQIADKRVVLSLAAALKDEDVGVRVQAISGLQQLSLSSKPAASEIRKALAD